MKKKIFGLREFVILAVIVIACYSVWPSIQVHTKSGEEKKTFVKENPKLAEKSVNFGLDLAGGTSITLEIDASELPGENIKELQEQSLEIVRNRVDQYGLSEPQISPQGDDRIVVELAGVDDSTAKELVGSTAKLEFKIVSESEKFTQVVSLIDSYLGRQANPAAADTVASADSSAKVPTDSLKDTSAAVVASTTDSLKVDSNVAEAVAQEQAVAVAVDTALPTSLSAFFLSFGNGGFVAEESVEKLKRLLALEAVQKLIPRDVEFAFGSGLEKVSPESSVKAKRLYLLKRRAEMERQVSLATRRPAITREDGGPSFFPR